MEKQLFLFSTECRHGVGGNLASLIDNLRFSDSIIRLIGAASGYQNGNQKLALTEKIDFHVLDPDEASEYEYIFKKHPQARFLFWDWHLTIPPRLFSSYPIFLLSPGPLEKFRQFSGPVVYTEAWKMTNKGEGVLIALYDLKRNGKKLWGKKINVKTGDKRKAINARMHHHMRSSLSEILEKIFEEKKEKKEEETL
jgi:hypothetical protein